MIESFFVLGFVHVNEQRKEWLKTWKNKEMKEECMDRQINIGIEWKNYQKIKWRKKQINKWKKKKKE